MSDRAVRQTSKGKDRDILALCDQGTNWSPRLKKDAIRDIENGLHQYYVPWIEGRTEIHVVNAANGKYLRTDRDDTPRNNLNDLPDCEAKV